MNLVIWNCDQALHRKADQLLELAPDIAIVPTAARQARTLTPKTTSHLWVGAEKNKGLGVYAFGGFEVELHASYDKRLQWVAPITVTGPRSFTLFAVWAQSDEARSPVAAALEVYAGLVDQPALPLVVAGDFNTCARWDKREKTSIHADTVRERESTGLVSAYHHARGVGQGEEPEPTYWRDRAPEGQRFHVDYCFLPKEWAAGDLSVSVGAYSPWIDDRWSDHVPLVVTVPSGRRT